MALIFIFKSALAVSIFKDATARLITTVTPCGIDKGLAENSSPKSDGSPTNSLKASDIKTFMPSVTISSAIIDAGLALTSTRVEDDSVIISIADESRNTDEPLFVESRDFHASSSMSPTCASDLTVAEAYINTPGLLSSDEIISLASTTPIPLLPMIVRPVLSIPGDIYIYKGCYSVNSGYLTDGTAFINPDLTPDDCANRCYDHLYFALDSGHTCICFSTFPSGEAQDSSHCDIQCPGNRTKACGGLSYGQIYAGSACVECGDELSSNSGATSTLPPGSAASGVTAISDSSVSPPAETEPDGIDWSSFAFPTSPPPWLTSTLSSTTNSASSFADVTQNSADSSDFFPTISSSRTFISTSSQSWSYDGITWASSYPMSMPLISTTSSISQTSPSFSEIAVSSLTAEMTNTQLSAPDESSFSAPSTLTTSISPTQNSTATSAASSTQLTTVESTLNSFTEPSNGQSLQPRTSTSPVSSSSTSFSSSRGLLLPTPRILLSRPMDQYDEFQYGITLPFHVSVYSNTGYNLTVTTNGLLTVASSNEVFTAYLDDNVSDLQLPYVDIIPPGTVFAWWRYLFTDGTNKRGMYWQTGSGVEREGGRWWAVEWNMLDADGVETHFLVGGREKGKGRITVLYVSTGDIEDSRIGIQGTSDADAPLFIQVQSQTSTAMTTGTLIRYTTTSSSNGSFELQTVDLDCFPSGTFPTGICGRPAF